MRLGFKTMPVIMSEFLGPGNMLSWRPGEETSMVPDGRGDGTIQGKRTKSV